jgi:hypothetical protein
VPLGEHCKLEDGTATGPIAPWYHYIPLKPDYSDLYDTMAFFVGPVDEEGRVDETKGSLHVGP